MEMTSNAYARTGADPAFADVWPFGAETAGAAGDLAGCCAGIAVAASSRTRHRARVCMANMVGRCGWMSRECAGSGGVKPTSQRRDVGHAEIGRAHV